MKSNFEYRKETLEAVIGQPSNVTNSREAAEQLLVALGGTAEPVQTRNVKMCSAMTASADSTKIVVPNGLKLSESSFYEIPDIFDFSQVTDWSYMFSGNIWLGTNTPVTTLDLSNAINTRAMFQGCTNFGYNNGQFSSVNYYLPNTTSCDSMFMNCSNLKNVSLLVTDKCYNFYATFNGCKKLETAIITTNNINNSNESITFYETFRECINLKQYSIDTTRSSSITRMFYNCRSLTEIVGLITTNCKEFTNAFSGCTNVVTIETIDLSNSWNSLTDMFYNCSALENVIFTGSINYGFNFKQSTLLTYDSIKSVLTACSNTTNTSAKILTLNNTITDVNGELAELISVCNTKGWTISGLTIN